jgi:dihydropteroate synthase
MLPAAFVVSGLTSEALEALVPLAARAGLELVTGPDWAVLSGSRSRLGSLARPWQMPEPLQEFAEQLGRALPAAPADRWRTRRGDVALDAPVILGILNITPDSFSDGGQHTDLDAALAQAERLLADGAAIIDVGGESTRPGAASVPEEEERRRVIPVIEALTRAHPGLVITVDTVKATVAEAAFSAGAAAVNDVSAFRLDPAMPSVIARAGGGVILMHSRGTVSEMASYQHADYGDDIVASVVAELAVGIEVGVAAGIPLDAIAIDPGFGFSKRIDANILLFDQLSALAALGRPILVGPSRKRFLGAISGAEVGDRDRITAAACALAYERGARLFRVHQPAYTREALALAHALGGS